MKKSVKKQKKEPLIKIKTLRIILLISLILILFAVGIKTNFVSVGSGVLIGFLIYHLFYKIQE